jgi:hypothetical protein
LTYVKDGCANLAWAGTQAAWRISNCQGGGKPSNGASFLFFEEFFLELF